MPYLKKQSYVKLCSKDSTNKISRELEYCYNNSTHWLTWIGPNVNKLLKIINDEYYDCNDKELEYLYSKIDHHRIERGISSYGSLNQ